MFVCCECSHRATRTSQLWVNRRWASTSPTTMYDSILWHMSFSIHRSLLSPLAPWNTCASENCRLVCRLVVLSELQWTWGERAKSWSECRHLQPLSLWVVLVSVLQNWNRLILFRPCSQFSSAAVDELSCRITAPVASADRRHLRSTNCQLLAVPRYRLNTYGRQAFSVAGPTVWNSLPNFIRDPTISLDCFRRLLKTYLFARY